MLRLWRLICVCGFTASLLLASITNGLPTMCGKEHVRKTRETRDNFEVLLNLYRINPLKQSKVFEAFSNRILAPNTGAKGLNATHFDVNESTRERQARTKWNLKQIAGAIHVTQPRHKELGPASFKANEIVPERFPAKFKPEGFINYNTYKANKEQEMFDDLLGHINSNKPLKKTIAENKDIRNKMCVDSSYKGENALNQLSEAYSDFQHTAHQDNKDSVLTEEFAGVIILK